MEEQLHNDLKCNSETPSISGRPSTDESQERFDGALKLYLQGETCGSEIGRKLGVSVQAGCDLLKRVKEKLGKQQIRAEDYTEEIAGAILRAKMILFNSWEVYALTEDVNQRIKVLNSILTTTKYLSDIVSRPFYK